MDDDRFDREATIAAVVEAGRRARIETLKAGVPVFYRDFKTKLEIMEMPDGRKYEIRYLAGEPREKNYEIVRELDETAA